MYDPSRVDVLEGSEDLIEEVLDVLYLQLLLGLDHSVQVGLHQLRYQIYVSQDLPTASGMLTKSLNRKR